MNITKNKNSSLFNTAGVIATSAAQWVIVSLLSRFYSVNHIGEYSFLLAVITPLHLLFSLQIRNYLNSSYENENIAELFKIRFFASITFLFLSLVVLLTYVGIPYWKVFTLLTLTKFFEGFSEFSYAIKQKEENIRYIGFSQGSRAILTSLFACVLTYLGVSFNLLIVSLLVPGMILAIIDLIQIREHLSLSLPFNQSKFKNLLPLAIAALFTSININIPRYLLEEIKGLEEVGIFTTIFFFYAFGLIVLNSILQVYLNKFSSKSKKSEEYKSLLKSLFSLTILITFLFIIGNSILGSPIYTIVYGEKTGTYSALLWHLNYLIPLGIIATKLNYLSMAQNSYRKILIISLCTLLAHLVLAYNLIDLYSIDGAFYAIACSTLLNSTALLLIILRKVKDGR